MSVATRRAYVGGGRDIVMVGREPVGARREHDGAGRESIVGRARTCGEGSNVGVTACANWRGVTSGACVRCFYTRARSERRSIVGVSF